MRSRAMKLPTQLHKIERKKERKHKIEMTAPRWKLSDRCKRRGLYDRIRLKPIDDDKVGTFAQKQSTWLHKIEMPNVQVMEEAAYAAT